MLPVTGTLLGLVYAGLIYWFQGPLDRLQHSRGLLEDILASHGKVLLDFLVGASLLALFAYFDLRVLSSLAFWAFAILVTRDLLRVTADRGYFVTVFSTKFVPGGYGSIRSFLRKLRNAGPANWWGALAPFVLTVAYPLWINSRTGFAWMLSDQAVSATLLTTTAFSLLHIRWLLAEAIDARKTIEKRLPSANDERIQQLDKPEIVWDQTKRGIEAQIIRERLNSIGLSEWSEIDELAGNPEWDSTMLGGAPVLNGPPWVKEDGSCHFNICVPNFGTDKETRECIFLWARRILAAVAESRSAVSRYSLSFFRRDSPTDNPHFAMIRAARSDVLRALEKPHLSNREFVQSMPGRYFSLGVA